MDEWSHVISAGVSIAAIIVGIVTAWAFASARRKDKTATEVETATFRTAHEKDVEALQDRMKKMEDTDDTLSTTVTALEGRLSDTLNTALREIDDRWTQRHRDHEAGDDTKFGELFKQTGTNATSLGRIEGKLDAMAAAR